MKTIIKSLILFLISLPFSSSAQFIYTPEMVDKMEAQRMLLRGDKPLFINGNGIYNTNGESVKFSCLVFPFTPYLRQGHNFFPIESAKNAFSDNTGAKIYNAPIRDMFMILYGKKGYRDPYLTHRTDTRTGKDTTYYRWVNHEMLTYANVELRGLDSTDYVATIDGVWYAEKGWNMQVTSTNQLSDDKVRELMIQTLEAQFGLKTFMEKQKKKSIILSKNNKSIPLYTGGNMDFTTGHNKKTGISLMSINDVSMNDLYYTLKRHFLYSNYPIVNETGLAIEHLGRMNFSVDGKHTYETFKKHFAEFGIQFSIEDREVDVLVITKAD